MLELGKGFAFIGRQIPLAVGNKEYFIDMLFYHMELRCYVVIELKSGDFKPEHLGKLSFYLQAVNNTMTKPEDTNTIGILLCETKDKIKAEYALQPMSQPMAISEYVNVKSLPKDYGKVLPTIEELEEELNRDFKQE